MSHSVTQQNMFKLTLVIHFSSQAAPEFRSCFSVQQLEDHRCTFAFGQFQSMQC